MKLRTRLRKEGIRCAPWRHWGPEIRMLPVSSRTLFRSTGTPLDALEATLKEEGWLTPGECLYELLRDDSNLKREQLSEDPQVETQDDWSEEDYIYWKQNRGW